MTEFKASNYADESEAVHTLAKRYEGLYERYAESNPSVNPAEGLRYTQDLLKASAEFFTNIAKELSTAADKEDWDGVAYSLESVYLHSNDIQESFLTWVQTYRPEAWEQMMIQAEQKAKAELKARAEAEIDAFVASQFGRS